MGAATSKSTIKKNKTKILFVGNRKSSFVKNDYTRLQKKFNVIPISMSSTSLPIFLFKTFFLVKWSDVVFCWFASWGSFFPVLFGRLLKKKSIVVAGGYDCANEPKINYGAFTNLKEKIPASFVLKNANVVLAVSNFTKDEMLKKVKPRQFKLIYNGVDTEKYKPSGEKEINLVITVGGINWNNLKRKGLETFVKSAKYLPKTHFVVIGKFTDDSIDYLKSIASSNVEFTGFVSDRDLIKWYQRAKVICQLSYYEAFGLTPAEGMACGCIPVVTRERAGLPEFVAGTGFYVPYGDEKATTEAIKKALNAPNETGKKARERIVRMFPIEKRGKELVRIMEKIV